VKEAGYVKAALAALLVVAADQLTKLAIVSRFPRGAEIDVLGPFLRLGHARNSGAVFGILRGAGEYFAVMSVLAAAIIVLVIYLARESSTIVKIGLGLVLGGAVGNLIDRVRYGAVVDFIDIGVNDTIRWPSFNVADLAITAGVIILIVFCLRPARQACGPADPK